jgi:RNA polymerase sigma-70 factor (ECF subfamily)
MIQDDRLVHDLIERATAGQEDALAALFERYRARLRQMVRLRLDPRLQGRVDPSDVIQDAYLDLARKIREPGLRPELPFFLWLRLVVGERLLRVHRHHLGVAMRDAGREISLQRGSLPEASSSSLAAQLLGRVSSASRVAMRAEMQRLLQTALNSMDPIDREVIALRHFEELSNAEAAQVLGITKAGASKRYVRAMLRLQGVLDGIPGLSEPSRREARD